MYKGRLIAAISDFDPHGRWFRVDHPTRDPRPDIFDTRWSESEGMMIGFLFGLHGEWFEHYIGEPSEIWDWLSDRNIDRPKGDPRFELSDWFWLGASRVIRMVQTLGDRNGDIIASMFSAARP